MSRSSSVLYIGVRGYVVAVDRISGEEVWRTSVAGSDFVNVVLQDGELYAAARGELFRLDPASGDVLWHNRLKGLGWGIVTIAGGDGVAAASQKRRQDAARSAAS